MKVFYLTICLIWTFSTHANYIDDRNEMILNEQSMAVGSKLVLNEKEQKVNETLMKLKFAELDAGFKHPGQFPPARHYFHARADIEKSEVFSFIRKMPKGGVLHLHDSSASSVDYLVKNITYRDNLYACATDEKITQFRFAETKPNEECWTSVKSLRENYGETEFDAMLRKLFSLETEDPEKTYPDINVVWGVFKSMFNFMAPLTEYLPVFLDYYYNVLQEFYDDNVKYIELRTSFSPPTELNGTKYTIFESAKYMKKVVEQFRKNHPDFIGVKFIYSRSRHVKNSTIDKYIKNLKQLQVMFPEDVIGFDLVGQEDSGNPLVDFIDKLQTISKDIHFFFHAGETDWNGMSTDLNLIDAILLNTTRIGHGYAVSKHPIVLEKIKSRGIAIELNPISNQVLMLVDDMRNHPASFLLSENYTVVVAPDDPGFWSARGLSYDFYEVFMGMASREADLRMLKQLALNSLQYSGLKPDDKAEAITKWQIDWDHFIDNYFNMN